MPTLTLNIVSALAAAAGRGFPTRRKLQQPSPISQHWFMRPCDRPFLQTRRRIWISTHQQAYKYKVQSCSHTPPADINEWAFQIGNKQKQDDIIMSITRASTMVKLSLLSDAASMSLHWIYDQSALQRKVSERETESSFFFSPPSCPYYSYPLGVFSPYGDESLPYLRSLSAEGELRVESVCENLHSFFSSYASAGDKGYVGRLNHVTKYFVAERDAGKNWQHCAADDSQANGIAKVPLIVARYAGDSSMDRQVEQMVRILQNNDLSVECSVVVGRLLEQILLDESSARDAVLAVASESVSKNSKRSWTQRQQNILQFATSDKVMSEWVAFAKLVDQSEGDPNDAWRTARIKSKVLDYLVSHGNPGSIREAVDHAPLEEAERIAALNSLKSMTLENGDRISFTEVAKAVGMSCALPSALINALYVIRKASTLEEAIHVNNLMAGDNCSRCMVIGAAFGAAGSAIPETWIDSVKVALWDEVSASADKISFGNHNLH